MIKPINRRRFASLLAALLVAVMVWQWSGAARIYLKAHLAQWLIAKAWTETLDQPGAHIKPWPWADTRPVARLLVPGHNIDLYVLAGAQGNSLAFGPGHHSGSPPPGAGTSVIGGHRDTHFRFLQHLQVGDALTLQTPTGELLQYRIAQLVVVNIHVQPLLIEPGLPGLVLVTCYPFDALIPDGPLRLVVWADLVDPGVNGIVAQHF